LGNIDRDVRNFKEVKERIDDNEGKREGRSFWEGETNRLRGR